MRRCMYWTVGAVLLLLFTIEGVLAQPADQEFHNRVEGLVREECQQAFNRFQTGGLIRPEDLSDEIIPQITREVARIALPLILERRLTENTQENYPLAWIDGEPVRVNQVRYEIAKMPRNVRSQLRQFNGLIRYLDEIFIVKRLFLRQVQKLKLQEKPEIRRQLEVARENLLVETFLKDKQENLRREVEPGITEKEMRDFHRDHLEELFQIPPRMTLAYIVKRFRTTDAKEREATRQAMEKARADLDEGVTFETVARKYSDDKRLILGKFRRDEQSRDPVILAGLAMLLEKHSGIIAGTDGWYIVMPQQIEEARTLAFDAVKSSIRSTLISRRINELLETWLSGLRASREIELFSDRITSNKGILKPDVLPAAPPVAPATTDEKKNKEKKSATPEDTAAPAVAEAGPSAKIAGGGSSRTDLDEVLARVESTDVTRREFQEYLSQVPAKYAQDATGPEGRMALMERLVQKKLIMAEAIHSGFEMDRRYISEYEALVDKILSKNLIIMEVASKIRIPDKDVEEHFKKFSEEVKARHILLALPPGIAADKEKEIRENAQTVLERARAGEDFATLAREYSDDPSRVDGGYLGYFTADSMADSFSTAAFSLKDGEISDLVQTEQGLHIIRVEEHRQRVLTDEVRRNIRDEVLLPRIQAEKFREYVNNLKKQARISYNGAAIRKLLESGVLEP